MGRPLAVLAIVAAAVAVLSALVFVSTALLLTAAFLIGAAVTMFVQRTRNTTIGGAVVLLLAILVTLGSIGSIGTENGSLDFGISQSLASALAIVGCMEVVGIMLWVHWDELVIGLATIFAVVAGLAGLLALVFAGDLANQSAWQPYVVSVLALATLVPSVMAVRDA